MKHWTPFRGTAEKSEVSKVIQNSSRSVRDQEGKVHRKNRNVGHILQLLLEEGIHC